MRGTARALSAGIVAAGLPDPRPAALARGRAVSYPVTVTNTGTAPEDLFLDPRLTPDATYRLAPQDQVSAVRLPLPGAASPPEWIVPALTRSVDAVPVRQPADRFALLVPDRMILT